MKSDRITSRVLTAARAKPTAPAGIVIGGQLVEVSQDHLLEPFVQLLASVEEMATVAACGQDSVAEKACVVEAYRSLYLFFHTLLPSASHQVIDGLTYSVSLLLVGEAIEVGRAVVASPVQALEPPVGQLPASNKREAAPRRSGQ